MLLEGSLRCPGSIPSFRPKISLALVSYKHRSRGAICRKLLSNIKRVAVSLELGGRGAGCVDRNAGPRGQGSGDPSPFEIMLATRVFLLATRFRLPNPLGPDTIVSSPKA